jgi:hypothetical protein
MCHCIALHCIAFASVEVTVGRSVGGLQGLWTSRKDDVDNCKFRPDISTSLKNRQVREHLATVTAHPPPLPLCSVSSVFDGVLCCAVLRCAALCCGCAVVRVQRPKLGERIEEYIKQYFAQKKAVSNPNFSFKPELSAGRKPDDKKQVCVPRAVLC